jgi:hypothetical protein
MSLAYRTGHVLGFLLLTARLPSTAQTTAIAAPATIPRGMLAPDIAFPLSNGGATIGGKPVGWSRAVILSAQEATRIEDFRCVFDLSYHVSNLGAGPTGPFNNLVRPLVAEDRTAPAIQEPATEQTGLTLGPRETKAIRTEISLAPGSWFVVVKADAAGQVKELEETGNNEGRFRVTLAGTCDGTIWGAHAVDYRSYLLEHLIAKNLKIGGLPAPTSGTVHLDAAKLQVVGNGTCSVAVDYLVENHGGLATQPFATVVQTGGSPQPTFYQITLPALSPGTTAPAHVMTTLPEGNTALTVRPVVVTSGNGEQNSDGGVKTTVAIDGACSRK